MKSNIWFEGPHMGVRRVFRKTGMISYALYRPYDTRRSTIDAFDNPLEALLVAEYINQHDGSNEADQRKAARSHAGATMASMENEGKSGLQVLLEMDRAVRQKYTV